MMGCLEFALLTVFALFACGDEEPVAPRLTGSVSVTIELEAGDHEPGVFAIAVSGVVVPDAAVGQVVVITGLVAGEHVLRVESESGCVFSDSSSTAQRVVVRAQEVVQLRLSVRCITPGTGIVRLLVLAPSGTYGARVDDGPEQRGPADSQMDFTRVPVGERWLWVETDLPDCAVEGANPQPVMVGDRAVIPLTVTVDCDPADFVVRVTTTGASLDRSGYNVQVTPSGDFYCYYYNCVTARVALNGSVRFSDLPPGPYSVHIYPVERPCTVEPNTYSDVTPVPEGPQLLTFDVRCP